MATEREAFVRLGIKNAAFRKGLQTAKRDVDQLVRDSSSRLGGVLRGNFSALGAGLLAGAGIAEFISQLDQIAKASDRLGFSKKFIQEFNFALGQTSVDVKTGELALQRFVRRTAEARNGTGEAKKALEEMGIQLVDSNGLAKDQEELFREVADALAATTNEGDRVRLAFKLFDAEGVKLLQTLQDGSAGLDAYARQAADIGAIVSDEAIDATVRFGDAMDVLKNRVLPPVAEALGNLVTLFEGVGFYATLGFSAVKTFFTEGPKAAFQLIKDVEQAELTEKRLAETRAFQAKQAAKEKEAEAIQQKEEEARLKKLETAKARELELEERLAAARRRGLGEKEELNELLWEQAQLQERINNADLGALNDADFGKLANELVKVETRMRDLQGKIEEEQAKGADALRDGTLASIGLLEKERDRVRSEIETLRASTQTSVTDLERIGGSFSGALVNAQRFSFRDEKGIEQRAAMLVKFDKAINLLEKQLDGGAGGVPADNFSGA